MTSAPLIPGPYDIHIASPSGRIWIRQESTSIPIAAMLIPSRDTARLLAGSWDLLQAAQSVLNANADTGREAIRQRIAAYNALQQAVTKTLGRTHL